MLTKLKQRWNVGGGRLVLIICTFAVGGSACGWLGRKLLGFTEIEGAAWFVTYIVVITILWPLCVLIVSIPLGQFNFFKNYLKKLWYKMSRQQLPHARIAVFASGAGSNAEKIIQVSKNSAAGYKVVLIVCNKPGAGVIKIAGQHKIPVLLIEKERFINGDAYLPEVKQSGVDFIVLAGFLWKVPLTLIRAYPEKIVNIHPALLPNYGGKGMYGSRVHEAVIAARDIESGISIHLVDEIYDHGKVLFQAKCEIEPTDTAATLAQKIHLLEHKHYPAVITDLVQMQNRR